MSGAKTQKRRGRPRKCQVPEAEIISAIHECRGYLKDIASKFGISINNADYMTKATPAARRALEEERRARDERYEQLLDACAEAGGERSIHFYLERRMPEKYGKASPDVAVQVNAQVAIGAFFEAARKSWEDGDGE